jgi:serine/threonine protein kinase
MEELEDLAAQRIGTTFGDWRIHRLLGFGAMASVYAATRSDGVAAALKVLHPHFSDVPTVQKRFLREGPLGRALATMAPLCDGIPQVIEAGVAEGGAAYLAMELLDGETVSERLARLGTLPVPEVLALADQVLSVLLMAHTYGIIHRDLKPENLHWGQDGRVKVLDFGIARVLDPLPDGVAVLPDKTATRAGMTLGTCHFMAPEQAAGLIVDIDGRTDLFGLGATLFELLSGRTIHPDLPGAQLLVAAATEPAPPLASVAVALPAGVCAVVDRALAFAKTERYPNAKVMRGDVRALRQGNSPPYAQAVAEGRIQAGASR